MVRAAHNVHGIPIVDIAPLRNGENAVGVGKALHQASSEVGFIYIINHGIPETVIATARDSALKFFRKNEAQKMTVAINSAHRGYLGPGGAKMENHLEADAKESFIWGCEELDRLSLKDHPLRGKNQWPDFMPGLKSIATDYFTRAQEVARFLMQGFALGLDLPVNIFLRSSEKPLSRMSFVYYPPHHENKYGVGPHTDFGVLTVLYQDAVGGLEIESLDGTWVTAPPIPGTLLVNVGDLLARWTNGAYRSTPHRVINRSDKERLSIVLAYDPEPDTVIDPREIFGPACDTQNDPITCGDYLTWRFEKAFSYRKAESN
ncbi:MAG: 2OG-Fe(II) oxygenase [Magnetovibrio sp.]|nr:2OG-Fe(II) oxygenase [Magnetovibrio sp.]